MKKEEKNNKSLIIIIGTIVAIICIVAILFLNHNQDIYRFNFDDGYEPGERFKGKINLANGEVDFKIIYHCSFPKNEQCPNNDIVKGKLNQTQLELVKNTYEKSNLKDDYCKYMLLTGVSYLIKGNKICNEETNETCEKMGIQVFEENLCTFKQ